MCVGGVRERERERKKWREREKRDGERERERVKELAHGIIKAWQVQNLQVGPAARRPRKELQFKCEGSCLSEFPFQEVKFFLN